MIENSNDYIATIRPENVLILDMRAVLEAKVKQAKRNMPPATRVAANPRVIESWAKKMPQNNPIRTAILRKTEVESWAAKMPQNNPIRVALLKKV